ncbi:MAG: YDG domain-containing protein, partial [Betaproteobacteria bacterium]
ATVTPGTLTINRAPLTVSNITAQNKTYDSNTSATLLTSGATLSGRIGSDDLSVSGTGTFDSANVGTSKTVTLSGLNLGGAAAGNYVLAAVGQQASTTAVITPAPLTIQGATASTTYTASARTNTFTASGLLGSDSVSSVSGRASGTSAGTYLDALSGATGTGLGNYSITYVNGALTITPAPLTIQGATASTTYTASAQTNTFTASGLLGSDSVSSVSGRASGTSAGTYLDTLSGATGTGLGNYSISYVNGALTITPAPLTIQGATASTTYTAGAQTNTFSASGLLGSDSVASVSGRASGTNAGTYLDTLSGATGTGLGNYSITYVNGALTITPAPLTMPQPAPNANDRAQIDIRRLTSVPDAVRLEVTPSFVFRLVLPLVPPREQPLSTLPQTHPGF